MKSTTNAVGRGIHFNIQEETTTESKLLTKVTVKVIGEIVTELQTSEGTKFLVNRLSQQPNVGGLAYIIKPEEIISFA